MKRLRNQKGAALLETAITLPLVLLVCVSIFEFGRAYQTWQVLTNAAREGARVAVLSDATDTQVRNAVIAYMQSGRLSAPAISGSTVAIDRTVPFNTTSTASRVTVNYPFNFTVLNPVIRLVTASATAGQGTTTMVSVALMRNES